MNEEKQIGTVKVKAKDWQEGDQHRIYFTSNVGKGQACWDVNKREWVETHLEFGARFKSQIEQAFGL